MLNSDERRKPGRHDDGVGTGKEHRLVYALRPMELGDLDQVMAIERESFCEPWTKGCFEHEILVLDASELTVAVSQEDVLGYTVAWFLDNEVHLANVAVRERFRGRGIGRTLVETVMSRAMEVRAEKVVLEVRRSNLEAQKLYETLGFLRVGVRKNYYTKEKEDAILMTCDLRNV
jgi:ribosomal-protein-alanine N-acetyltransferase